MRRTSAFLVVLPLLLLLAPLCRPAAADCVNAKDGTNVTIADSTPITDPGTGFVTGANLINSAPCGTYNTATSRYQSVLGVETAVAVPYMKHEPSGTVKAIVVLLPGGQGQAGLVPDPCIDNSPPCDPVPVASAGNNFLVRSAQVFADRGFRTLTIDQPSPLPSGDHLPNGGNCGDPNNQDCYDLYRQSQRNALDIAAVVRKENPGHKPVFLVGTSRGTESAVAQNGLGVGIVLSSPVTLAAVSPPTDPPTAGIPNPCDGNHTPYVDDCYYGALKASIVKVPVQIVQHADDPVTTNNCYVAPATSAMDLRDDVKLNGDGGAGVDTFFRSMSGGFQVVDPATGEVVDACGAQSFHGFLGIELEAVHRMDRRMTLILQNLATTPPDNPPIAKDAAINLNLANHTSRTVDLANLVTDADCPAGDCLAFAMAHPKTARGAALGLSGSVVTYDASAAPFASLGPATIHDAFVYVASDGSGKQSIGIIRITVTVP
jgi:hypothetical protein